jgi:hypothetical protein
VHHRLTIGIFVAAAPSDDRLLWFGFKGPVMSQANWGDVSPNSIVDKCDYESMPHVDGITSD